MKIQTLGIIFIIIILPITFALSLYTKTQLDILAVQREYDAKLQSTTYDALKAFQINAKNNTQSTLADSKLRDLEASINAFFNSLQANLRLQGYTPETLKEYVPALVYTMYDGYYIYSPYSNVATTDDEGVTIDQTESDNIQYGLKPYVYYSCRYKRASDDFVITYSLDNYITIKGIIGGKYVNDSGYLISNIQPCDDGMYEYNGIKIEKETMLKEYIGENEYPYIKISGTKYYLDEDGRKIFYLLNGKKTTQVDANVNIDLYIKYRNLIVENSSALRYYKEAYEFTDRVLTEYGIRELKISEACDANGNPIEFENTSSQYIFRQDELSDKTPLEYSTSNFNQHRKAVIRYSIETNLSMAIANFNRYSNNETFNYQMPRLKEYDWDTLASDVSIISFLQGVNIGGKIYNGYSVVINSETEELVSEEDIYIIGKDGYYHRVEDEYLLGYGTIGEYTEKYIYSKGVLDLDFQVTSMRSTNNTQLTYYYPRKELACYKCVVNQTGINVDLEYSSIYEYLNKITTNTQSTILRKTFYTALGRERWGKQFNSVKIEDLDKIETDDTLEKENNGIEIELSTTDWINQDVIATIKFSDSINLDKVVVQITEYPKYDEAKQKAYQAVIDKNFIELNSNEKQYSIANNSVIYVIAYSKNGQQIHKSKAIENIDKIAPTKTIVTLKEYDDEEKYIGEYTSGVWISNNVEKSVTAEDEGGSQIARFEYSYNGSDVVGEFPLGSWKINYTIDQMFFVRAVDTAGNAGSWSDPYVIRIDKVNPSKTQIILRDRDGNLYDGSPTTAPAINKDVLQYASATENHSGIARYEYSYDGTNIEGVFTTNPYKITEDSNRLYWVRAVDNVGNIGEWSEPYKINIDTIPPGKTTVTLTYEDGSTYVSGTLTNRNVKKEAYAYDVGQLQYQYRFYGQTQVHAFTPNPWTISRTAINEQYQVRAVDWAGNIGEWSDVYTINIDKDPPVVGNALRSTVQNYNEVKLELRIDNVSDIAKIDIKYKINGASGGYQTITDKTGINANYQKVVSGLEYATTYDMYLILYDKAGNGTETGHVYPVTEVAEKDFPYSSNEQTYTVLATGYYKIDAWGADGADYSGKTGGNGGYVTGVVYLNKGDVIKVNTGTRGTNYGGTGSSGGNGGGRTDVTANSTLLLVAGGGGGANAYYNGGDGGKTNGSYTSTATGENGAGAGGGGKLGGKSGNIIYHVCDGTASTGGECYKTPIYHTHIGTSGSTSPNGCYTKPSTTKKTCTVSAGWGRRWRLWSRTLYFLWTWIWNISCMANGAFFLWSRDGLGV